GFFILGGNGNLNSFPSHSTGLFHGGGRDMAIKPTCEFMVIRGGINPDLDILVLALVWRWDVPASVASWLVRSGRGTFLRDLLLILWVFELGEGFRVVVRTCSSMLDIIWYISLGPRQRTAMCRNRCVATLEFRFAS